MALTFVSFTTTKNEELFVIPQQVTAVVDKVLAPFGGTRAKGSGKAATSSIIILTTGREFEVEGNAEETVKKLNS